MLKKYLDPEVMIYCSAKLAAIFRILVFHTEAYLRR
jgi:hypothetical protein